MMRFSSYEARFYLALKRKQAGEEEEGQAGKDEKQAGEGQGGEEVGAGQAGGKEKQAGEEIGAGQEGQADDESIHYLGSHVGLGNEIRAAMLDATTNNSTLLLHGLFGCIFHDLLAKSHLDYQITNETKYRFFFAHGPSGKAIIYMWAGNFEPEFTIVGKEYYCNSYEDDTLIRGYNLINGSQMFCDQPELFLFLVNQYVKDALSKEIEKLQEIGKSDRATTFLNIQFEQQNMGEAPEAMMSIENINNDQEFADFEEWPMDMIPCRMVSLDQWGTYYFVNKNKFNKRAELLESDIKVI